MRGTVPRLPLKQEIVDTLMICAVFVVTALIYEAWPFRIFVGFCFSMALIELFINAYCAEESKKRCNAFFCVAMAIVLITALVLLFTKKMTGRQYLLWIGLVTAADASGLLFGRLFGRKQPFFSREVSPNKTYAGYIGEIFGSIMAGWLIMWVLKIPITPSHEFFVNFGFAGCIIGDLLGSAAKRELGIKDSECYIREIPILGKVERLMRSRHGFLDCFDSASVALIYFIALL